jgi:hypothetical protein
MTINRSKFKKAKIDNNEVQVKMYTAKKYREREKERVKRMRPRSYIELLLKNSSN